MNQRTNKTQPAKSQSVAGNVAQKKSNNTGLPDNLKSGIEGLSGYSMDDVKVHYNSQKPAQLQAHAFAQGNHIHLASGQEKHLPHEAWHVVQQKQGRVQPTMQLKSSVPVNDDPGLEKEADVMGAKALIQGKFEHSPKTTHASTNQKVVQARWADDIADADADMAHVQSLQTHYNNYKGRIEDHGNARAKRPKAKGLKHWAMSFLRSVTGADAELRRITALDRKDGYSARLGVDNVNEPDIETAYTNNSQHVIRMEEVKAVSSKDNGQVNKQLNAALAQLEGGRNDAATKLKASIYIYNHSNPWPWKSLQLARGKSAAETRAEARELIDRKRRAHEKEFLISVIDVNLFSAQGVRNNKTDVQIRWPAEGSDLNTSVHGGPHTPARHR